MATSKRRKELPVTFPEPSLMFICGLSNQKSSLTNQVEENGQNRKWQLILGTFLWCCAEIVPNNLAGTRYLRYMTTSMANFCG